jgi:hypothetical protein
MDNGLIFPYRRNIVRAEASDAKHARLIVVFGSWSAESVTQSCSRQAAEGRRKVALLGFGYPRAKCVGLNVGKSAFCMFET